MAQNMELKRPLKTVNKALIKILLDATPTCGDFVEFGVWEGDSFDVIYDHARYLWRVVHAVDTFSGSPQSPIKADNERWPVGSFDTTSVKDFKTKYPNAVVHEGTVPDVLDRLGIAEIGFVHLDMDHEYGTKYALQWCWPRMVQNGILVVHDYSPGHKKHATKAVDDWMARNGINYVGYCDGSIFFRKGVS